MWTQGGRVVGVESKEGPDKLWLSGQWDTQGTGGGLEVHGGNRGKVGRQERERKRRSSQSGEMDRAACTNEHWAADGVAAVYLLCVWDGGGGGGGGDTPALRESSVPEERRRRTGMRTARRQVV